MIALEFSLDELLVLSSSENICYILRRRIVNSQAPKHTSKHFSMINVSIVKKHPTIVLQNSFKKIAAVQLSICKYYAQTAGLLLFINIPYEIRRTIDVNLSNTLKMHEFLTI